MCILGGGSSHPHAPNRTWYERQAKRGGWFFDRALPRLVGHAFAAVLAGDMTWRAWWVYETNLSMHRPECRYRRLMEALWPPLVAGQQAALDGGPGPERSTR